MGTVSPKKTDRENGQTSRRSPSEPASQSASRRSSAFPWKSRRRAVKPESRDAPHGSAQTDGMRGRRRRVLSALPPQVGSSARFTHAERSACLLLLLQCNGLRFTEVNSPSRLTLQREEGREGDPVRSPNYTCLSSISILPYSLPSPPPPHAYVL